MSASALLPDGWLTADEADELRRLADGKRVLELGAWKGRSTVVLASVASYVVSVDRHQGILEVGGEDSLPDYLEAVRTLANVAIVVAGFEGFVPLLDSGFDFVYVDGDHDAVAVERDARFACEHAEIDGVVAFHDWDFASVREGVSYVFPNAEPRSLVGSVASFAVAT